MVQGNEVMQTRQLIQMRCPASSAKGSLSLLDYQAYRCYNMSSAFLS